MVVETSDEAEGRLAGEAVVLVSGRSEIRIRELHNHRQFSFFNKNISATNRTR